MERYLNFESFFLPGRTVCDVLIADIELRGMNGLEGAARFKKLNPSGVVVLVDDILENAILGYNVDACDFWIRPIKYADFAKKFEHALTHIDNNKHYILINNKNTTFRVAIDDIQYVEVNGHHCLYHVAGGMVYDSYESLSSAEKRIASERFIRCNSCYLVNVRFVREINGMNVKMSSGAALKMSKYKKTDFMKTYLSVMKAI